MTLLFGHCWSVTNRISHIQQLGGIPKLKMLTIAVEGNIGAGKSCFMSLFETTTPSVKIIKEPVEEWTDLHGVNLLALMYNDPCRCSASFQSYVMLSMLKLHCDPIQQPVKLMERCIFSARYVRLGSVRLILFLL